jgi:tRNA(fMet)-specific endonuclease VapC
MIEALLLLDTSIVIHLLRGKATGECIEQTYGLRDRPERPLVSIVTLGELRGFARYRNWGAPRVALLDELVRNLIVVDIRHASVLDRYAEIHAFCRKRGSSMGDNDKWIAATASAARATLITTDQDFAPLHGEFLSVIVSSS